MEDQQDPQEPNWQQFRGSELGGLLTTIYGNPVAPIKYPKVKTVPFQPKGAFNSSGSKPIISTKRNVTVAVPKVGGGGSPSSKDQQSRPAAVDCIPRRKQTEKIEAELETMRMQQKYYRGGHIREVGEKEKDRCAQIFGYKGGKALPDELTCPAGDAPFELAERRMEKQRQEDMYKRKNPSRFAQERGPPPPRLSELEQLKEQIITEINERRDFLIEMKEMNLPIENEAKIKEEISKRIRELHQLEFS